MGQEAIPCARDEPRLASTNYAVLTSGCDVPAAQVTGLRLEVLRRTCCAGDWVAGRGFATLPAAQVNEFADGAFADSGVFAWMGSRVRVVTRS